MAENLLTSIKNNITPDILKAAGQVLGISNDRMRLSFMSAIPTILSAVFKKGNSTEGAQYLLDLIRKYDLESGIPANILNQVKEGNLTVLIDKGMELAREIFGRDLGATLTKLVSSLGLNQGIVGKVLSMATPFVMGPIGSKMKELGMDPSVLMNFLNEQKNILTPKLTAVETPYTPPSEEYVAEKEYVASPEREYAPPPDKKERVRLAPLLAGLAAAAIALSLFFREGNREMKRQEAGIASRSAVQEEVTQSGATTVRQMNEFLDNGDDSELPKIFRFSDLNFHIGSLNLTSESMRTLDLLAASLNSHRSATVKLDSYTDNTGTPETNQTLSVNRAEAVKQYLMKQGVNPDQITTAGMGESNPVASNDTPEGRQTNRRMEIVVTKR